MSRKKEDLSRDELLERMAQAYQALLEAIAPVMADNKDIKAGINEGLNKFLSNVCISLVGKRDTDYYSEKAYDQLKAGKKSNLVYEHVVPKAIYQKKIVNDFLEGKIKTVGEIKEILDKYWRIATITKEEDNKLSKQKMPKGWKEGDEILARYEEKTITLRTWGDWEKRKSGNK